MKQGKIYRSLKPATGHNATFGPGDHWFLNACVGSNTGANTWEGYRGGFQAGAEVLLAAAGVSRPEGASESWGMPNVDYLVYPVCLCARHHVELSLKLAIPLAWKIFKLRCPNSNKGLKEPREQDERHGLMPLWESLNAISEKADRRLGKAVSELEGIIQDFNKVDPTGQVFRYATDLDSSPHLADVTHINLQTFAQRYSQLSEALEALLLMLSLLTEEYATGSFTAELDREQLIEIAEILPDRANWGSDGFLQVKQEIIDRYGLTSKAFQRAVRKIERTRSLAVKIGVVEPLNAITVETFEKVKFASQGGFRKDPGFSADECAAISALLQISGFEFPEHYTWYSRPLSEAVDEDDAASLENEREWAYLARKVSKRPDMLLHGLAKLGQAELVMQLRQTLKDEIDALKRARDDGEKPFKVLIAKNAPAPTSTKKKKGKGKSM